MQAVDIFRQDEWSQESTRASHQLLWGALKNTQVNPAVSVLPSTKSNLQNVLLYREDSAKVIKLTRMARVRECGAWVYGLSTKCESVCEI